MPEVMLLLALMLICPAVTWATVTCPDGSYCPDGNTCCAMQEGGYGCCPTPSAVCCTNDKCCPEGSVCLTTFGLCIHVVTAQNTPYMSPCLSKTPSMRDVPCPSGTSCPDGTTCCGSGCCPLPSAVCCPDRIHCCPSGYQCDMATQQCVLGDGSTTPMRKKQGFVKKGYVGIETLAEASPISQKIVVCPGGQYYCPDNSTCCTLSSGQWGCCAFPFATCCSDHLHCCPNGMQCDVTGQRCLSGIYSQSLMPKTFAKPMSNLKLKFNNPFPF